MEENAVAEVIKRDENGTEKALELLCEQNTYIMKAIPIAVSQTSNQDWQNYGDTLYLQASGAMKMNRVFRVSVDDIQIEERKMPFRGQEKTIYIFRGKATMPRVMAPDKTTIIAEEYSIPCKATYDPEDDNAYMTNVTRLWKKAETQLLRDAIVKLVGLENYTKEELKDYGKEASQIKFDQGTKGGKAKKELSDKTKALRKRLSDAMMTFLDNDKDAVADMLQGYTEWKDQNYAGLRSFKDMSEKQVNMVWGKFKKDHEGFLNSIGFESEVENGI